MSGILGALREVPAPGLVQDVVELAQAMAHRGCVRTQVSPDGRACLASFSHEQSKAAATPMSRSGVEEIPCVLDGRLDNRKWLQSLVADDSVGPDSCSDDELVRRLFLARGPEAFKLLKGEYAIALYDGGSQQLHLACDVTGTRMLSFSALGSGYVFATDNKPILASGGVQPRPNDAALAELLLGAATGASRRGETLFSGVMSVGRGEVVSLAATGVERSRVRDFHLAPYPESRPYSQLCDEFRHLLIQAVQRRLDASRPTAITVSGGLDSSSLYCIAKWLEAAGHLAHAPIGINFTATDGSWADEREYTDAIVRQYGGELQRVALQPDGCLATAAGDARHSESVLMDPMGNLNSRLYACAASHGARVYMTGYWGDDAFSPVNYWYDLLWSLKLPEFWHQVKEHHQWIAESTATPLQALREVLHGTADYAMPAGLRTIVKKFRRPSLDPLRLGRLKKHADARIEMPKTWAPSRRVAQWNLDCLDLANTRHYLAWQNRVVSAYGLTPAYPFLDEDVVQWLLRCPSRMLNPGGRYKGLLRDAMKGIVPEEILNRRTKGDFTELVYAARCRELPQILQRMVDGSRLVRCGFVTREEIDGLREELGVLLTSKGDGNHTMRRAASWAALEYWLEAMDL